jgi:hypothetical protein
MPRKRPVKKGSFGSHFDELVKQFPNEQPTPKADGDGKKSRSDGRHINDRLFESAWRKTREAQRPATNSQIDKARSPAAGGS